MIASVPDPRARWTRCLASWLVLAVAAGCGGGTAPLATGAPASPSLGAFSAAPTDLPDPTPMTTVLDGATVSTVWLGDDAAPIDVVAGFGSIWVANHRVNTVSRFDPETLEELARIDVGAGPGLFVVMDDALWVTNQLGRGLTRIDPSTNGGEIRAGTWPPCSWPVVLDGYIWQMACDAGQIMRIDPNDYSVRDYTAYDHHGVVAAGDELLVVGEDGLARLDREADDLEAIDGGCCGFTAGIEEGAVWLSDGIQVHRVSLEDGSTLATLPIAGEVMVDVAGDRAWITRSGLDVLGVDLTSYEIERTLALDRPTIAREVDGLLWVTSIDANTLSRVEIPVEP